MIADAQAQLPAELRRYAGRGYVPTQFADAVCACGRREFLLRTDDAVGVAVRTCGVCGADHVIGDGAEYLAEAELDDHECLCGSPLLEITIGVALYADSEDVRWLYVGGRCPACGLAGCYADWKNEFEGFRALLARV